FQGEVHLNAGRIAGQGDSILDDGLREWAGVRLAHGNVVEFNGPVSGPAGLAVSGPGTLVLARQNTFYGELRAGDPLDTAPTGTTIELRGDNAIGTVNEAGQRRRFTGVNVAAGNRLLISQHANLVGGTLTLTNGAGIAGAGAVVVP